MTTIKDNNLLLLSKIPYLFWENLQSSQIKPFKLLLTVHTSHGYQLFINIYPYCCTPHILEAAGPLMKLQLPPSGQVGTCAGFGTFGMSTDTAEDHQVKNYPHKTMPRPLC